MATPDFIGDWEQKFDEKNTAQDKFFLPNDQEVRI